MYLVRLGPVAVAVACLLAAGCLGVTPESDLGVTNIDGDWTDEGDLAFDVTVTNRGGAAGTGTLLVQATVDGETYVERREVSLEASESKTYAVVFDVPAGGSEDSGGYDVSARME